MLDAASACMVRTTACKSLAPVILCRSAAMLSLKALPRLRAAVQAWYLQQTFA